MFSKIISLLLYLFVFILASIFMEIYSRYIYKVNKKNRTICFILLLAAFIGPLLLGGFRACGTDIYTYVNMYNRSTNTPMTWFWEENGDIEIIFNLLARFARDNNNIRILFISTSLIVLLPIYKGILEHKDKIFIGIATLAFLMNYYTTSFNILRQYMAISIVCYSYKYVFKRDFIKYLICFLIAICCHTSAIAAFPIYFLWTKSNDLVSNWKVWFVIIVLIILVTQLQSILGSGVLSGDFEKYSKYSVVNQSGGNRDFFLNVITLIMIIPHLKNLFHYDIRSKLYFILMVLQCIIGLTGFNSPYIKRVAIYYGITQIYMLGMIPKVITGKWSNLICKVVIVAYIIGLFLVVVYYLNQPKIIPYKWLFPEGLI